MRIAVDELPGHDIVSRGLADLVHGRESEESLLVEMAGPRLRAIGFEVPERDDDKTPAGHRLYERLTETGSDGYSRYNALIRRMVSFARAAEHAAHG